MPPLLLLTQPHAARTPERRAEGYRLWGARSHPFDSAAAPAFDALLAALGGIRGLAVQALPEPREVRPVYDANRPRTDGGVEYARAEILAAAREKRAGRRPWVGLLDVHSFREGHKPVWKEYDLVILDAVAEGSAADHHPSTALGDEIVTAVGGMRAKRMTGNYDKNRIVQMASQTGAFDGYVLLEFREGLGPADIAGLAGAIARVIRARVQ